MSTSPPSPNMDYILYSFKASLQKFTGEGGFKRLLDSSRLTLLSFLGEFESSQDEVFTKRGDAVMKTRQCLLELNRHFDTVDEIGNTLIQTFGNIIATLDEFHKCCDKMGNNEEDDFFLKFEELRSQNVQLKKLYHEFSALKLTPKRMNSAAIEDLESSFLEASRLVGSSQTGIDVHRRKVQVRQANLNRAHQSGDTQAIQDATSRLSQASNTLESVGAQHFEVVKKAMEKTHFSLEQTSMSSWSSSNVFFAQLGDLFSGLCVSTKAIANICCLIKNMQTVSKKISEEKGQALEVAHAAARNLDLQQESLDPSISTFHSS